MTSHNTIVFAYYTGHAPQLSYQHTKKQAAESGLFSHIYSAFF